MKAIPLFENFNTLSINKMKIAINKSSDDMVKSAVDEGMSINNVKEIDQIDMKNLYYGETTLEIMYQLHFGLSQIHLDNNLDQDDNIHIFEECHDELLARVTLYINSVSNKPVMGWSLDIYDNRHQMTSGETYRDKDVLQKYVNYLNGGDKDYEDEDLEVKGIYTYDFTTGVTGRQDIQRQFRRR